jgi:hypothetical protein
MTGTEIKILKWYANRNGKNSWEHMVKAYCETCLADARSLALFEINKTNPELTNEELITKLEA